MPAEPSSPSNLIRVEARALLALAMRLDGAMQGPFEQAVGLICACLGSGRHILVTGMGKSGLVARKIAATLTSTGTPSLFLHPADALHGDLGIVSEGDVAIALSTSGETEEILRLIPILKQRRVGIISLTGSAESSLWGLSDVALDSSVTEEACALNLAPTASTTVMLALGDALAIEVSRRRNFLAEDFAGLHPGGHLGRRLTPVRDLMHAGDALPTVHAETLMPQVIYEMSRKKLGMTTVISAPGTLLGIISDGDLRRVLERDGARALDRTAGEIMNGDPVTIQPSALAPSALMVMEERKITSLIVTGSEGEAGCVLGVVHLHDLWKLELP